MAARRRYYFYHTRDTGVLFFFTMPFTRIYTFNVPDLVLSTHSTKGVDMAGKSMTQSQIIAKLAESAEISKKQVKAFLDSVATLAYKEAKNGFTLPGLGKLVLVDRKARIGRNPATGEAIKIPAKKVVKFRVAKAAKEAIAGKKK